MPLVLTLSEITLKPFFPGYIGVAYEWFWFLIFFAVGFACIVAQKGWYSLIETHRVPITILALTSTIAFVWIRLEQHSSGIPSRWRLAVGGTPHSSQSPDLAGLCSTQFPRLVLVPRSILMGLLFLEPSEQMAGISQSGSLSFLHSSHAIGLPRSAHGL